MATVYGQLREALIGKTIADLTFGDCDDGEPGEYVDLAFADGTSFRLETEGTFFPAPPKSDRPGATSATTIVTRFGSPRSDLPDHP
jgi:hypothetical protein